MKLYRKKPKAYKDRHRTTDNFQQERFGLRDEIIALQSSKKVLNDYVTYNIIYDKEIKAT